jgi:hypothetical protein
MSQSSAAYNLKQKSEILENSDFLAFGTDSDDDDYEEQDEETESLDEETETCSETETESETEIDSETDSETEKKQKKLKKPNMWLKSLDELKKFTTITTLKDPETLKGLGNEIDFKGINNFLLIHCIYFNNYADKINKIYEIMRDKKVPVDRNVQQMYNSCTTYAPLTSATVAQEPVARKPVAQEPMARKPVAQEPVAQKPVARVSIPREAKTKGLGLRRFL